MANNRGGAIIPYQPTYSIQYKYGDRYGGQNFAKPTTAINTGQAGGPLSAQATLDEEEATQTIVNPTTTATSGDGETLDSKDEGTPGGTGGANFSEVVARYTPVQPDFGWQYAHNYGDDPYTDPPVSDIFDTPESPPRTGFEDGSSDDGGGNDYVPDDGRSGRWHGDDKLKIPIIGFEIDNPFAPDAGDGGGATGDPEDDDSGKYDYGDPTNVGIGKDDPDDYVDDDYDSNVPEQPSYQHQEDSEHDHSGGGGDQSTSTEDSQEEGMESDGYGGDYKGALIPPKGVPRRFRDNNIPNPIFQDPLADYFRRA